MIENPKVNDIAYCVKRINCRPIVSFGIISDVWNSESKLHLKYLELVDDRLVNGIPIKDFERTKYKKLPKSWTYNTVLYDITHSNIRKEIAEKALSETGIDIWKLKIDNPEDIKIAYNYGLLVESEKNFHGTIETRIEKEHGYYVYKKWYALYDSGYRPTSNTFSFEDVYTTYNEAQDVIDAHNAELKRQASLTDEEWSIEQIMHTIDRYAVIKQITPEMKEQYKNELLSFKNIEDLETRICGGCIQWKYVNNKRWNTLCLEEQL